MNLWAVLLLVGSVTVLRDDVNSVPAGEWRYQQFTVGSQLPAEVDCNFKAEEPGRARVELVTHDALQQLLKGREHDSIATSTSGMLHQEIGLPGTFALVIVNLDRKRAVRVAMRVTLDTSGKSLVKARYLSPERRQVVIVTSCVGFLLIVGLSARQLLAAMKV